MHADPPWHIAACAAVAPPGFIIVDTRNRVYAGNNGRRIRDKKYDGSANRGKGGRPRIDEEIERLIVRFAEECLSKLVLFGQAGLRHALDQFVAHCHEERNHQGRGNVLLFLAQQLCSEGPIACKARLGGLVRFYYREAA